MFSSKNSSLRRFAALAIIAVTLISGVNFLFTPNSHAQNTLEESNKFASPSAGNISGLVYVDYNMNGARDTSGLAPNYAIDTGVAGVSVTAFDTSGASTATTTDSSGAYAISMSGTGPFRVEFTNLPIGYFPSAVGSNNSTAVRVVPDGTTANVDLGITRNKDFTQTNPLLVTPVYTNGDPLAGGTAGTNMALAGFRYSGSDTRVDSLATASQIGATWGIAWQANRSRVFSAATIKRHVGVGPQGKGGIYVTNVGATYSTSNFVDLAAAPYSLSLGTLGTNSARGLPADRITPNNDVSAFQAVGKQGLGDIDIDETGNNLWGVNINTGNQSIFKLDVSSATPGAFTNYPLSGFAGVPTCTNGVFRPWAIAFNNGLGYLGGVCTAESAGGVRADLRGYVLSFDPNSPTVFATVLDFPLSYNKGVVYNDVANPFPANSTQWYPWTDTYSDASFNMSTNSRVARPTPILTDIEFDTNNSMSIGFLDRATSQIGYVNYRPIAADTAFRAGFQGGDILKACQVAGLWSIENNGSCGSETGSGVANAQGPGNGEFYAQDLIDLGGGSTHQETSSGSLATYRGSREVISAMFDPLNQVSAQGVVMHNTTNGAKVRGIQLFESGVETTNGLFGKANGIGDLELLKGDGALQVGNLVWNDANNNGVQDPNESGIQNVTVQLWADTTGDGTIDTQIGTALTGVNGDYVFGGVNNSNLLPTGATCTGRSVSSVTLSSDDGREATTNAVASNFSNLLFDATTRINATRFNNLAVPNGATITSANMSFVANTAGALNNMNLRISAENVDNAATILPVNLNISSRPLSATTTDWNTLPAYVVGTRYTTPNIAATVQSITSRPGWVSGNSIMLMVRNNVSTAGVTRDNRAYDAGVSNAPSLDVNYSVPCRYFVNPNTTYQVRIPGSNFTPGQTLDGYTYTRTDINSGTNSDARDSDGSYSNGDVIKNFATGESGENNHTYDMGFTLAPTAANVSIDGRVALQAGNGVRNAVIILTEVNGTQHRAVTSSFGYYRFDEIPAGQTVVVSVRSKRFTFNPSSQVISLNDSIANVDFIAQE